MQQMIDLFTPFHLGGLELRNRIVLSPMTRTRAGPAGEPDDLNVRYYAQRATAGLLITEAAYVDAAGVHYRGQPGMVTEAHVEGWCRVVDAVHEQGAPIVLQLYHSGRVSHPAVTPDGKTMPVAPSPVRAPGRTYVTQNALWFHESEERLGLDPAHYPMADYPTPRELSRAEIHDLIENFRRSTELAFESGFDGVELHCGSGYLHHEFLSDEANRRTDAYGGTPENRSRFVLETVEAMAAVRGAQRLGVKITPGLTLNGLHERDLDGTYGHLIRELNRFGLAYLHAARVIPILTDHPDLDVLAMVRPLWNGPLIAGAGFDKMSANDTLRRGQADLIAFARLFLANPDLPRRLLTDGPFNKPDERTFYGAGPDGYTNYPPLTA